MVDPEAAHEEGPALHDCHRLLFLQMACEKLAKAYVIAAEPQARLGHDALMRLPGLVRRREVARALGYGSTQSFTSFLDRLRPTLQEIASLSPSVRADGRGIDPARRDEVANVEYPWAVREDEWLAPSDARFDLLPRLRRRGEAFNTLRFLEQLLAKAEKLAPTDDA